VLRFALVNDSVPHPLPEPLIDLVAQRFRVLGEPMRIKLLDRLREGAATVGELQEALGASQQNVSKHLGILHSAGMVGRTKDGNHARYSISDPSVFELCDQVCGGVRRQLLELDELLGPRRAGS
jgi:DNA-binding transcriptional ArsR family regulator